MKTADIKNLQAAELYARALFQSAVNDGIEDKVYDDIVFISETINSNEDLKNVLMSPVIKTDDKKEITEKIFKLHVNKISLDFILLLLDAGRIGCLNEAVNSFQRENNKKNNIIMPLIISAVPLDEGQKQRITAKLEEKTNKKIIPEYSVNADIIGGIIVEIDDKTIDCSISAKFENMKKHLTKENSYGRN